MARDRQAQLNQEVLRVRLKRLILLTCAALIAAASALTSSAAATGTLTGAGSGLVAPLEAEWAAAFQALYDVNVNYSALGSTAGITDISSRSVDFGATDQPMTSAQASACHSCYQIPWALSALGIGYHIQGVTSGLLLTPTVLAEIYLGQIKQWNDSRIRALNPALHLPSTKITPIYATGAGDTYVFTNYLSAVNSTWKHSVGTGTTVSFPTGVQANGNAGVTATLESTDGAIAYDGAAYLIAHQLPAAAIENAAGNYEYPNLSNIEAAAKTIKKLTKNALYISNPPRRAKNAYPLATFVYAILPSDASQKALLKSWLLYALGAGQAFGPHLDYATIPSIVLRASVAAVNRFGG
jgi:phosphate transport system substrate-binding protein